MKIDCDMPWLDDSPDAVIATTPTGRVLRWSAGAEAVFGYTSAEAAGQSLDGLVVPADHREEEQRLLREARQAGIATCESLQRRKDGSLVCVDVSAKAVRNARGRLQYILWTAKDVTPRRVLRDAKRLEARFGELLESTPDGIVLTHLTGRIVLANRQAEKLFGYGRHELRGQLVEMLTPARFRQAHAAHRADYFRQPHTRPMGVGLELLGLRKDGAEFPVEISLSPLQTEEGTLVMSAIRDITERKRVERELQHKNAELSAANEELDAFSYSISHDLRAPVRAMAGFARILSRQFSGQLPVEAAQAIERIHENAAKMGQLIDGLLAFSRLSRRELVRVSVDPAALARAALDELQAETAGRRVDARIADLPACAADPMLLRQVFTNLLSNALKYTRGRDPAVIRVGCHSHHGRPVYFVRDNGAGFDMAYAARLFQVFQRLHSAEQFEGTGVGLAIVQRIVRRHGGRIWAEARVDHGATFYFTVGETPPGEPAGRAHQTQPAAPPGLGGRAPDAGGPRQLEPGARHA